MSGIWKHIMTAGLLTVVLPMAAIAVTDEEITKINAAMPNKPVVSPQRPRTMLVFNLSQGFKHSSIPYWARTLDIMAEKTGAFKVVHSEDKSVFASDTLAQFDAICFNNTTGLTFTDAQKEALMAFVKGGKGIVGIHAGSDNFPGWPEASHMIGGVFQGHPWGAGGTWAIKIDEPDHPLMKPFGGKGFKVNDEIYRTNLPYYSRDKQRVLMSLDMTDETTRTTKDVTPEDMDTGISWIKPYGKGRVFYCSLGHNHHLTWTTPVLEHYLAGIQYAMGDLKVDDAPLGAAAAKLDAAAVQTLVEKARAYDWGKSRADLTALQAVILSYSASPEDLKAIETLMQPLLAAETNRAVKDFACRELSVIATGQSVPALAALLDSPETEHMARYALERIPGDAVDMALLRKLSEAKNTTTKVGVIASLGVRRFAGAVGVLAKAASMEEKVVAEAAVQSLGSIGNSEAVSALAQVQKSLASDLQPCVLDALVRCGDRLAKDGKTADALAVYESLYAAQNPSMIRLAALTGIAQTGGDRFKQLLPTAIASEDASFQAGAIRLVAWVKDPAAIEAAAGAMPGLSDAAKIPMLAALAANGSPAGRKTAEAAMAGENKEVRIAAYQTVSVLGDGGSVMRLAEAAAKTADRAEKDAARQALYRIKGQDITLAIERGIGQTTGPARNEEVAAELIRAVSERAIESANALLFAAARDQSGRVAQEALRALQTTASAKDMPAMADLLADRPGTATENATVAAAEKIADRNQRASALLARLKTVDAAPAKVSFVRVLGRLGDVNAIETLRTMRASSDAALSDAAFRAMVDWPGTDFFDQMRQLATGSGDETQKVLAFRAYIRMLASGDGKTEAQIVDELAGAMKLSDRPQEQRLVLSALAAYGTPKALDLAQAAMANPELKAEAEVAVVGICEKLLPSAPEKAMAGLEAVKAQTASAALKERAQKLLNDVEKRVGFIVTWQIAGPFTEAGKGGDALLDVVFEPEKDMSKATWRPMPVSGSPEQFWLMDIMRVFEGADRVAYARTVISSPQEADAVFEIGSDDGVKVWLNGKQVHAKSDVRPVTPASDKVPVRLAKGENTVLMKIMQGSGDWGFCLRVTTPDGTPMRGLSVIQ
jgi:hypothetical protein